jgi:hypothetical protein
MFVGVRVGVPGQAAILAPATGIITANRQVWLRKGTAAGASWPDASGNARNMTLVGSPTIGASSVTFNGTTQYGTIATSGVTTTCSIYLRLKQVAWADDARIISGTTPRLIQSVSTPDIALIDSDATPYATNGNAAVGAFASLGFVQGGGNSVININGTEVSDISANNSWSVFSLAATSAGASPSNIEVVEVIAYNVAHNGSERAQMIAYLGTL